MASRLASYLRDQVFPALFTAALAWFELLHWVDLVPVSQEIERDFGSYGLLLAVSAAVVASGAFIRESQDFGVANFLLTIVTGLIMLPPFIAARHSYTFGLDRGQLHIITVFAYLGLHVVAGIFVGGLWTVVLKTFQRYR